MKGSVATRKCAKGLTLEVLSSGAGFYIGTFDEEGPNCRVSSYFRTREDAEKDLGVGARFHLTAENQFCCPNCWGY